LGLYTSQLPEEFDAEIAKFSTALAILAR